MIKNYCSDSFQMLFSKSSYLLSQKFLLHQCYWDCITVLSVCYCGFLLLFVVFVWVFYVLGLGSQFCEVVLELGSYFQVVFISLIKAITVFNDLHNILLELGEICVFLCFNLILNSLQIHRLFDNFIIFRYFEGICINWLKEGPTIFMRFQQNQYFGCSFKPIVNLINPLIIHIVGIDRRFLSSDFLLTCRLGWRIHSQILFINKSLILRQAYRRMTI